ncbi:MAG: hypothetical protein FJX56_08705 [Alphaproteobacteria bacterium]|nr:hypothetical protein [Alphaproteobacteria bacterium]
MQFLLIAYDGTDAEAPARRAAVRERHLVGARRLKAEGKLRSGGAILDDAGTMIGSAAVFEFPSRAELDAWLAADPYVTDGVWRDITIRPFREAVL